MALAGTAIGLGARLALFLLAVTLLHFVAVLIKHSIGRVGWLDPVYTRAALHTIADVRIQGLAVAGPLGDALHGLLPSLFLDPSAADGALVRLVVAPGRAVLGRLLASNLAHAGVLALGLLVVYKAWQRRRPEWLPAGLAIQAQVAIGVVAAPPSVDELEATGVSFAANALLPWLAPRSGAMSDALDGLSQPLLAALLVGLALLAAYLPGAAVAGMVTHRGRHRSAIGASILSAVLVVGSGAASASAWARVLETPVTRAVDPEPALLTVPVPRDEPLPVGEFYPAAKRRVRDGSILSSDRWFAETQAPPVGPSHVEIRGSNYHYEYRVNGQPEVIRGMGLNTQYASQLSPADRQAQLERDFVALRALGVNTVLGWDPDEFDSVLLDVAQAHGVGVVLPFDLNPGADYTDPAFRAQLTQDVLAWVEDNRAHPALRMWGLGNEVLHKIVHPAWVGPQDPAKARNARAFADWLIETADAIHALDPDHPVTYRSAEDAFAPWVADALRRRGGGPRPWFVWGTNTYQDHLADIVDQWPDAGMDQPLWVSEFAPGGLAVPDRPDGFRALWAIVRRHPDWVLGGAVYAWTRNGPEGVDRTFGLTDDGVPVDGRSLDALGELFNARP